MREISALRYSKYFLLVILVLYTLSWRAANADIVISSGATSNMSCSGGLCEPTASAAVLNATDLENMLASGNVTVTTTGSDVQANNIHVKAPVAWSNQSLLALDATFATAVDQEISVAGPAGLSLATNGEIQSLTFGTKGRVAFQNLSSRLMINGISYTLVNTVASLAIAIASNPSGSFALTDDYDASQDGTYSAAPIQTIFTGTFDGLGNTISRLSIHDQSTNPQNLGLFFAVLQPGIVEHVRLVHVNITGGQGKDGEFIGSLVGDDGSGYLFQDSATGKIRLEGRIAVAGGIAGVLGGELASSFAEVEVDARMAKGIGEAGGLVGGNEGVITSSFATGSVAGGKSNRVGGLVGGNYGLLENSYSTGAASGGDRTEVGGLIGRNKSSSVQRVYSTGTASGGNSSYVGGFAGLNYSGLSDSYWDTDMSGTTQGVGKGNKKGITGLTTEELQSGLPAGFDSSVWGEKKSINNGLPYLLANPPPK